MADILDWNWNHLRMLGSEVTVFEAMDSVLPIFDKELRQTLESHLKKRKIKTHLGVFAKGVEDQKTVELT